MANPPSTSLLMILALYTSLRRSGSSEIDAMEKLRQLVHQLSREDRQALIKGIDDWETQYGQRVNQRRAESDAGSTPNDKDTTVLRPSYQIVMCPSCGKKNDAARLSCAYCGKRLEPDIVASSLADVEPTWFGIHSKLVLTFSGAVQPLELLVETMVTLGRHTADYTVADIDLSAYQADLYGVSRLHAILKRQANTLTLIDMHSTNHTFLNGTRLKDGEVYTLKTGDKIRLGRLGMTVIFKHPK